MGGISFDGGVTPPPGSISRMTIGDVLRRTARRVPDNIALVDGDRRVTYAELDAMVNRAAHFLISQGLEPGNRCAMMFANSVELVVTLFGIHRAGLIWVPINLMLDGGEVEYTLTHAGVSHVMMEADFADHPNLGRIVRKLNLPHTVVERGKPFWSDFPATEPDIDIDRDDVMAIMYTSGTTSKPKGVMQTHQTVLMAILGDVIEWSLTRDDGIPIQLPLFHCGAHLLLLSFFVVGGKCVLIRGFDPGALLRTIEDEKLTVIAALPMMYAAMLDHPEMARKPTTTIRLGIHAMAPMYESLIRRLVVEFCPNFVQVGGQTEIYPATLMSRPEMQLKRFGNVWGHAGVMTDFAIMGADGELLPQGEIGELVHRGPSVMYGYYRNQEATDEVRRFGWHHTGDVGRVNEWGEFEFLDRTKDMIKSGGENVSSMQVEAQLLNCPQVHQAIAVGIPHHRWGEAVTAFVIVKPGVERDAAPILEELSRRLGNFQMPKKIVFVDEMPMTATGKLRKVELRMKYADLYENEQA